MKRKCIRNSEFALEVAEAGAILVHVADDTYTIESTFSYPGEQIGHNYLSVDTATPDPLWATSVEKKGDTTITLTATGTYYTLKRRISLKKDRLQIKDTLKNVSSSLVGIMVSHNISAESPFREVLLGGANLSALTLTAENPTIFLSQANSRVGIIAEDNVLRLQMEAYSEESKAGFGTKNFALNDSKQYTFEWSIYPFPKDADYFDFVNTIRRKWKTNFIIEGPWDFFNARDPLLSNPEELKRHLGRKKLRMAALTPWTWYWDGAPLSREEHQEIMQNAMRVIKQVSPDTLCLGCIEHNIVAWNRSKMEHGAVFDDVCLETNKYPIPLSPEQTKVLAEETPWGDSLLINKDGVAAIEDVFPKSYVQLHVYPADGNYQAKHLMEQAKFVLEEIGLDGIYMDQFNMAFDTRQRYSYDKWDGYTVDIDPETGQIICRYTDAGLVGAKFREELARYILSKGKAFVANTHSAVRECQSMPIHRFMEAGWLFREATFASGEEPAVTHRLCRGQLSCPIGLGAPSSLISEGKKDRYAEIIMRAVIAYLRHGILYYHYSYTLNTAVADGTITTDMIPETGPGSGEYGPINHMFPITPVELHKGWVKGKERIVTATSIDTLWKKKGEPKAHIFDLTGRPVDECDRLEFSKKDGQWHIILRLNDWQEIGIIE